MIFLITALLAEAKPLIHHFALKKIFNDTPFPIFRKENIYLIVSGIGKESMMSAVSYLAGFVNKPALFLNIGLAGHKTWDPGTIALISKISDVKSDHISNDNTSVETFYPTFLDRFSLPYAPLITVDIPESQYQKEALYDMEGSAFFKSASLFTSSEFIHCLKIVSDNPKTAFRKELASSFIESNINHINHVVLALQKTAEKISPTLEMAPLLENAHFTETQRHQLKRTLQRLQLHSADDILNYLEKHVSSSIY